MPKKIFRIFIISLVTIALFCVVIYFVFRTTSTVPLTENLKSRIVQKSEWDTAFKWSGIDSLPDWAVDKSIEAKGNEFSREFVITFSGAPEQIKDWLATEPVFKRAEVESVSDTETKYILNAQGGAQYAEVIINSVTNTAVMRTYWS